MAKALLGINPTVNKEPDIFFGSYDPTTGESQEGYIDFRGKMRFRRQPWYKRLFMKPQTKTELLDLIPIKVFTPWGTRYLSRACLYRKANVVTGKTIKLWATRGVHMISFNTEAFDKFGQLVRL